MERRHDRPGHRIRLVLAALLTVQVLAGGYGLLVIAARSIKGSETRTMDRTLETVKKLERDGVIILPQQDGADWRAARPFANVAKYEGMGYANYGYVVSCALIGFGVVNLGLLIADRFARRTVVPGQG